MEDINLNDINRLIRICEKEITDDAIDYGIFTGYSGLALLFYEKHRCFGCQDDFVKFEYYLDKSLDSLKEDQLLSLCSGTIGVYYLIFYLTKNNYFEENIEVSFSEFPEYADELITYYYQNKNFDYLHGFLGVLFLCIELYSFSTQKSYKERIERCIKKVINYLKSLSVEISSDQIAWISKGLHSKVEGYSFGFAHGIPSIISLLTKVYYLGIEKDLIEALLSKTYNFIKSIKGDYEGSNFPNFIILTETEKIPTAGCSRLAWCYGDIGVGISLLNYGLVIKDESIVNEANQILLQTTRRDYSKTGIVDVFLCHGTSGLIMMYNYLFKITGIEHYKKSSHFWLKDTISKSQQQIPNLKTWLGSEGWIEQNSILEGKAGLLIQLYSTLNDNYNNPLEKLFLLNYYEN